MLAGSCACANDPGEALRMHSSSTPDACVGSIASLVQSAVPGAQLHIGDVPDAGFYELLCTYTGQ